MIESLDAISRKYNWKDFNDVVYNCENRKTIMSIVEEAELHLNEHTR